MRLTYELGHGKTGEYGVDSGKDMPVNGYIACINKLGQLEDLEDKFGIDLIVLFKALKEGIWTDHYNNGELYHMQISPIRAYLTYKKDGKRNNLEFKDYGKTWALTKEELEKNELVDSIRRQIKYANEYDRKHGIKHKKTKEELVWTSKK